MEHIFYNRWEDLARSLIIGVLAYVFLIGCLRWSGKRTLSKMNAFDFIVTISLGSVPAALQRARVTENDVRRVSEGRPG